MGYQQLSMLEAALQEWGEEEDVGVEETTALKLRRRFALMGLEFHWSATRTVLRCVEMAF